MDCLAAVGPVLTARIRIYERLRQGLDHQVFALALFLVRLLFLAASFRVVGELFQPGIFFGSLIGGKRPAIDGYSARQRTLRSVDDFFDDCPLLVFGGVLVHEATVIISRLKFVVDGIAYKLIRIDGRLLLADGGAVEHQRQEAGDQRSINAPDGLGRVEI